MNFTIDSAFGIAVQTFTSLYAGVPAKILVLVIALLLCFVGCRMTRWASALYGVIAGVALGTCATGLISFEGSQVHSLMLTVFAMLIGGIVLGAFAFRFHYFGLFIICSFLGVLVSYVPATFVREMSPAGFWGVLLVCGLLFGITGVLFVKPAYLIATSLSGIPAGFALTGLLGSQSVLISTILGCVLAVFGFVVQLYLFHRLETGEEQAAAEDALQDTDPHLPVISDEPKEEPDDIDKISDRVAEHIGMTGSFKTDSFLLSDAPETVEDSTMLIPKAEENTEEDLKELPDEQAAKFAWTEEEKIVPQELAGKMDAVPVEQPDQTAEAEAVEDSTMMMPKTEETAEEDTSKFAWVEEEQIVLEKPEKEPAEASVEELDKTTEAESADEVKLWEELEKQEESIPKSEKTKKSKSWFFFRRKEKKQADQPEVAEQLAETVEASAQLELADIILTPKEEMEAESAADTPQEDEMEAVQDLVLALEVAISEIEQQESQTSDKPVAELAEMPDQMEVVSEPVPSAEAKLTEALEEVTAAAEQNAADAAAERENILQELATERIDMADNSMMTEEIPAESLASMEESTEKHSGGIGVMLSIVLVAAALIFAAVGIQFVEIMLALCFVGYVQKHYRSTAFACATLCVRRAVDIVLLVMQQAGWTPIVLNVVSCIIFLVLTFTALHAFFHKRYAVEKRE